MASFVHEIKTSQMQTLFMLGSIGSNAEGDFHMRPLVIGKYENPRVIAKVKETLPVIYRHNTCSWKTKQIFF